MKHPALWMLYALIAILAFLSYRSGNPPPSAPERLVAALPPPPVALKAPPPSPQPSVPARTWKNNNDARLAMPAAPILTFTTGNATQKKSALADSDLIAVKGMLRDYRATFGQNPVGNNAEIAKALLGNNSRGARFNGSNAKLNKARELVDRWDRPYFFHQISRLQMEVRSAGPDGVMWNADDEVSL